MHARPHSKTTPDPAFYLREYFHLNFLKHLDQRLSGKGYALKGGVGLRLFHRSPRLSEDLDLDVFAHVDVDTLKSAVDGILKNKLFLDSLAAQKIVRIITNRTKQTVTTQRWKVQLHLPDASMLQTKIEFNRKSAGAGYEIGAPATALLNYHKTASFTARFYSPTPMAALTIQALTAGDDTAAARAIFDLHHLFSTLGVDTAAAARLVSTQELEAAAQAIDDITYKGFKNQVLDQLTGDRHLTYTDPQTFIRLKTEIEDALIRQI